MPAATARPALLFDLDGTLIDSIGLLLDCMEFAFSERTQLAEWSADDRDVEALVTRYRDFQDLHLERLTSLYPGVRECLDWARDRGHPLAIVTSKGKGMTARSLAHVGIAEHFQAIVTYEETTRHKPLADPVLLACARLRVAPADAIFVGDSPHDMFAGRAAGAPTAAALWGPFRRDELAPAQPTHWLCVVSELRDVVERAET